ncbi:hypothetical protein INR49_010768 [Caranx melampygus]|nr:hypothetical protein INR49_010768 [Caranx melampygus]
MSFPLASITVYNSVVFGFFSNTQRLISKYRYGDGRHPCSMLDLTVASMLTGLVSVGLGAPVDLVRSDCRCRRRWFWQRTCTSPAACQMAPTSPCAPSASPATGSTGPHPLHQQHPADRGPPGPVQGGRGHDPQGRPWIHALLHSLHHLLQPAEAGRHLESSPVFDLAGRRTGRVHLLGDGDAG